MPKLRDNGAVAPGTSSPHKDETQRAAHGLGFRADTKTNAGYSASTAGFEQPGGAQLHGMANMQGMAQRLRAELDAIANRVIAKHGMDPRTRAQAAAHEAGHTVATAATGYTVLSSRIYPRKLAGRRRWLGRTMHNAAELVGRCTARDNPRAGKHAAVITWAGIVGERLAGVSHPASSLDEFVIVQAICDDFDRLQQLEPGTYFESVTRTVTALLEANRPQFERVRKHLAEHRALSAEDAALLVAGVVPVEMLE